MKLTTFLMIIWLSQVSAAVFGQKITYKSDQATIQQIINEIRWQTGYNVLVSANKIENIGARSVDFKEATLEEVMDTFLQDQPLVYVIENKTIIIQAKETSILDKIKIALNMAITITGKVQDGTGQPMVGVNVVEKGKNNATVTDAKGNYSISVTDQNSTIRFSYVGYETIELKVKDISSKSIITLKAAVNNMQEVVINKGYYSEKRELSTGNVSIVTAKEIEQQPVTNVLEALEGRVPGLLITQTTGLPGGAIKVDIRGQNSLTNGNTPFYLIDGVPYESSLPASPLQYYLYGGNPLSFLNPNDIETVEILKDADATAIYGSKAANGAILITTKRGKIGSMKVNVNMRSGFTDPASSLPVMNTQQYLAMRHEAFRNDGELPGPGDHDINGDWDTTRYTDWAKVMANKPAQFTTLNADVSGGSTNFQYLIGAGYSYQNTGEPTLLPGDGGASNTSLHFNINTTSANNKFKVSLSGNYASNKNTVQADDFTSEAVITPPDAPPLFKPDGSLNWMPLVPGQAGTFSNPYGNLYIKSVNNTSNLIGSASLSYTIIKGLEISTGLGYTNQQIDESYTIPTTAYDPGQGITSGSSRFQISNAKSWSVEPQIAYDLKIGKGSFSALIGTTFQSSSSASTELSGYNFISDALLNDLSAAGQTDFSSTSAEDKYQAVYGRLGYNWEQKYLLNFTARRDGTSRFGPGKQFGNFGAVGVGWIFTKEDFFPKNGILNFGKLRASYGLTGSDQVGDYQYISTYNPTNYTNYPYGGLQGLYPQNLFNANLAWETTRKPEVGIELGFFNNRINLTASYYRNRSSNELVQTPVSSVTGFTTIASNLPATVQNSGAEFELHTVNIKGSNFGWISFLSLSIPRNKLVAFPNLASSPYAQTYIVGRPVSIIKVYQYAGVNPTTGVYQFATSAGQLTSNPDYNTDFTQTVDLTPKYEGFFENTFTYKSFSLNFSFQYRNQIGKEEWSTNGVMPGLPFNQPYDVLNRWQKPGDKAEYEKFTQDYTSAAANAFGYATESNFAYGDASFIRLKNMAASWQVPTTWVKKIGMTNGHVNIQCQNLATFTKYNGLDPETQSYTTGPRRAYTLQLQFGF